MCIGYDGTEKELDHDENKSKKKEKGKNEKMITKIQKRRIMVTKKK